MNPSTAALLVLCSSAPELDLVSVPAGSHALGPNLAVHHGIVLLSWLERVGSLAKKRYRLRIAELGQHAWENERTIWERADIFANWADFPSVTVSERGEYLAHWAEKSGRATYAYDVRLASSRNGWYWKQLGTAHDDRTETEHGFVSVIPQGNGFRAFWLDGRAMARRSTDGRPGSMTLRTAVIQGGTVRRTELIDARVCECCGTSAAQASAGPFVVYRDRGVDEVRDISIVRRVNGRWTEPKVVHSDGWKISGCPVNGPATAAHGDHVVVAWYTGVTGGHVRVAFSRDGGATFGDPIQVNGSSGTPLGRVDVVFVQGRRAIVSWTERGPAGDGRFLARSIDTVGRLGPPVSISRISSSRGSGFPRMIQNDRELVFAWTDVRGSGTRIRTARLPISSLRAGMKTAELSVLSVPSSPDIGAYRAQTLSARPVGFASLDGNAVLVNIWATWCKPCRDEVPKLVRLHEAYAGKGLTVLAINVDESSSENSMKTFLSESPLPYTVWRDPEDRVSRLFGVTSLPATFLLDKAGKVRWSREGMLFDREPRLHSAIHRVLRAHKEGLSAVKGSVEKE